MNQKFCMACGLAANINLATCPHCNSDYEDSGLMAKKNNLNDPNYQNHPPVSAPLLAFLQDDEDEKIIKNPPRQVSNFDFSCLAEAFEHALKNFDDPDNHKIIKGQDIFNK